MFARLLILWATIAVGDNITNVVSQISDGQPQAPGPVTESVSSMAGETVLLPTTSSSSEITILFSTLFYSGLTETTSIDPDSEASTATAAVEANLGSQLDQELNSDIAEIVSVALKSTEHKSTDGGHKHTDEPIGCRHQDWRRARDWDCE